MPRNSSFNAVYTPISNIHGILENYITTTAVYRLPVYRTQYVCGTMVNATGQFVLSAPLDVCLSYVTEGQDLLNIVFSFNLYDVYTVKED